MSGNGSDVAAGRAIMSLPIVEITVGARIGLFNPTHASRLGASMEADGQHTPIHVQQNGNAAKRKWTLVAGLHRLRGAEGIGRTAIDAIRAAGPDATSAELRRLELSENLDHGHRRPIERAMFMVEHARQEEAIDHPSHVGESRHDRGARLRYSASATVAEATTATVTDVSDWRQRTATAMGCSLRSLERYQRIHRAIVVELVDESWRSNDARGPMLPQLLNFHPLGESIAAMTRLATLNPIARLQAANAILSRPECESMDEVLKEAGLAASTGNSDDLNQPDVTFMTAFGKMKGVRRRVSLFALAAELTPTEVLGMIDVFKNRGIIDETIKIS